MRGMISRYYVRKSSNPALVYGLTPWVVVDRCTDSVVCSFASRKEARAEADRMLAELIREETEADRNAEVRP